MSVKQTAETRARIMDLAGKLFRARGFDGVGVADLMRSAGLTHGAFYTHFESKDALAAYVSEQVLVQKTSAWSEIAEAGGSVAGFEAFIATYLSASHRDDSGNGCLISALGGDVARHGSSVRRAFTAGLRPMIDFLARYSAGRFAAVRRERALVTLATLVGTIMLARAVDDTELSEEVLHAARGAFNLTDPAAR
jgi:TetR/AcrR family transcriptional repressor of nem operon